MASEPTQSSVLSLANGGALLEPTAWANLKAALDETLALPCDANLDELQPPLARVKNLLDLAAGVNRGNPLAIEQLRRELSPATEGDRLAYEASATGTWVAASATAGCFEPRDSEPPPGPAKTGHPLLPLPRFLALVAAAVLASREVKELAVHLAAVEQGLAGLSDLFLLYDLAVRRRASAKDLAAAYDGAKRRALPQNRVLISGGSFVPGVQLDPSDARPLPDLPQALRDCLREAALQIQISGFGVAGDGYRIDSVEPRAACAGDLIRIEGVGFTGTAAVEFTRAGGPAGVAVEPSRVTDTLIEVALPSAAGSGRVWLYIPERVHVCAGLSSLLARPGQPGSWSGGAPRIIQFGFPARRGGCLNPGTQLLTWEVEPEGSQVVISETTGGTRRVIHRTTDLVGSLDVTLSSSIEHRFSLELRGECPPTPLESGFAVHVGAQPPLIEIAGIEMTQGVQRYDLHNPAAATNNNIALVAGKDTVVRVFVRKNGRNAVERGVQLTGVLRMGGRDYRPMNDDGTGHPYVDGSRVPRRDDVQGSLNFLIPAGAASGSQDAEIDVFTVDSCPIAAVSATRRLVWVSYSPFPVSVIRFSDPGTNDQIAPGAAVDLITEAFERLPSNMAAVRFAPRPFQIHAGTTEANYCHDGGYYQLALSLAYQHNFEEGIHHSSSWVGIYWQTGCSAGGMMSWPYTSSCITSRSVATAAHEIAHTIGMGHTWEECESIVQPVACHKPLPFPGNLQEVVFDIRRNRVVVNASDLQSYQPGFRFLRADHWEMTRAMMNTRY